MLPAGAALAHPRAAAAEPVTPTSAPTTVQGAASTPARRPPARRCGREPVIRALQSGRDLYRRTQPGCPYGHLRPGGSASFAGTATTSSRRTSAAGTMLRRRHPITPAKATAPGPERRPRRHWPTCGNSDSARAARSTWTWSNYIGDSGCNRAVLQFRQRLGLPVAPAGYLAGLYTAPDLDLRHHTTVP